MSEITARHIDGKQHDRDVPAIRKLSLGPSVDAIIETVGVLAGNNRLATKAGIYLSRKYSGARLKEIGERFGIGESGVSQMSRRFAQELERDNGLMKLVDKNERKTRIVKSVGLTLLGFTTKLSR